VDPAENIAEMANKAGVPTEVVFWGKSAAEEIRKKTWPSWNLFLQETSCRMWQYARLPSQGLALALKDDGILLWSALCRVILKDLHYDSIYHDTCAILPEEP